MRWEVVTDRSLRIRTGVWRMQALILSLANLQQIAVPQNPGLRLLVPLGRERTDRRRRGSVPDGQPADSLHAAEFHSVDNAPKSAT